MMIKAFSNVFTGHKMTRFSFFPSQLEKKKEKQNKKPTTKVSIAKILN